LLHLTNTYVRENFGGGGIVRLPPLWLRAWLKVSDDIIQIFEKKLSDSYFSSHIHMNLDSVPFCT